MDKTESLLGYQNNIAYLQQLTAAFFEEAYEQLIPTHTINVNVIAKDIDGDYSIVLFPYLKRFSTNPQALGDQIIQFLKAKKIPLQKAEVVKGFLNLTFESAFYDARLNEMFGEGSAFGSSASNGKTVIVEFCSPNTNKPIHLGHIRNILIGWSMSSILEFAGRAVKKVQIINDRGIAICKSMVAWKKLADGATPDSQSIKGDHFVGNYYVQFEKLFQKEYIDWQSGAGLDVYKSLKKEDESKEGFFKRYKNTYFNEYSQIGKEAREMLQQWESGEESVISLWKTMNGWVYDGFDTTYQALGVNFDKLYYESETYLRGKSTVEQGLVDDLFYRKEDGSIWVDLEEYGLDQKILLRSDGTSVYITQDIGTALQRYDDYAFDQCIYVVADEQDYHFQALFATMKKAKYSFSDQLYHLSYGMVDLPSGKMKSREGTVVDADDLITEVIAEAKANAKDSPNLQEITEEERAEVYNRIGLGALKYFILKVAAKKRMTFDPSQSVDMQGQTGPYIQNAYVRINSVLSKSDVDSITLSGEYTWSNQEKNVLILIDSFPRVVQESASEYDPSKVAHYAFDLAKEYHKFYHEHRILTAETDAAKVSRLLLSEVTGNVLKTSLRLLGIEMPERM